MLEEEPALHGKIMISYALAHHGNTESASPGCRRDGYSKVPNL